MKVVKIANYEGWGWTIVAKKVERKDHLKLQRLIKKLDLKRNKKLEKKIKELGGNVKNTLAINRIYPKFSYTYVAKHKLLALNWGGKNYDGYEFVSLWLSN